MPDIKIKRALIAVYDKTGIAEFAKALVEEFGIEIISTGGTARHLKEAGIPVTMVEEVTGFPEMLDGRVKTLHPKIHAAILADRDNPDHMRQLAEQDIKPIDMVVVNLYPFKQTIKKPDCTFEEAIEMIDIGGPCLLRAAAKNHRHVVVLSQNHTWDLVLDDLRYSGDASESLRMSLASLAFRTTGEYDSHVEPYLMEKVAEYHEDVSKNLPVSPGDECGAADSEEMKLPYLDYLADLRYGENPHQQAQVFREDPEFRDPESDEASIVGGESAGDVAMSFNNFADANAALELCKELTRTQRPASLESVGPAFQPVTEEQHTRRHLPHIQKPGSHYFVTFRLRSGQLSEPERDIVLDACRHWHGRKLTLHACVVMPDHVHLVITPHEISRGQWVSLGTILQSIKGLAARQVNKARGLRGALWQDESWDRIIRDEKEYAQRWDYIENNPVTAKLGENYKWLWLNQRAWEDLAESDRLESGTDRLESGTDRLESRSHRTGQRGPSMQSFRNTAVFIKHTNACGAGLSDNRIEAYRRAYLGDPNAAMGGILAVNFEVDEEFATAVMESLGRWGKDAGAGAFFIEVWLAPAFDEDAVKVIRTAKKWGERVRLLAVGDMARAADENELDFKKITGGMLVQSRDLVGLDEDQWKVATERTPSDAEMADLRLAWLVCKHTKSNAITVCKDGMLIGNGAGQMSRVMSCRIATWLATENGHAEKLKGAVAASDAFFPFRDGPDILIEAGVTAIIQPGGSKRDQDTIDACNERGVAMVFTGTRHFKH